MSRTRHALALNRLLLRHEKLTEKAIAKHFAELGAQMRARFSIANPEAVLRVIDQNTDQLAEILKARMMQTAGAFGEYNFGRLEDLAKSYYPGISFDRGPVNDPDAAALVEISPNGRYGQLAHLIDQKELASFRDIFRATIENYFTLHALSRAVTVSETLKGSVRSILRSRVEEGLGEAVIARDIERELGGRLSRTNAARIARTETHTAANIGADEAARATGLDMVKEWSSAEDGRVRRSHANADGQTVGKDERFRVGSSSLMFPGDPRGPAKEIINCRCTVLHHPVIDGEIIR